MDWPTVVMVLGLAFIGTMGVVLIHGINHTLPKSEEDDD